MRLKMSPERTVEKSGQASSVEEVHHGSDGFGVEIFNLQSCLVILHPVVGQKHLTQNVRFGRHDDLVAVEGVGAAEDLEVREGVVRQELLRRRRLLNERRRISRTCLDIRVNNFGVEDCKLAANVEAAVWQE